MTTITFDYREQKLYEAFTRKYPEPCDGIAVLQKPLHVGDVTIQHSETGLLLVFERKTEQDMVASIKDGRYREQKMRMLHAVAPHCCTYLIENRSLWNAQPQPQQQSNSSYIGSLLYSMYRDQMHVVVLPDMLAICDWLFQVATKIKQKPEKFLPVQREYVDCLKVKQKKLDNIDRITCYQLQWCQVPGISQKLAKHIAETYPSWERFYQAMRACADDEDRIRTLCKIPLIGRKKAQTIWDFVKDV